jgi:hypothetical protein
MDFLLLGRSPASRQTLHPLLQVLGAISHQSANFDESRAALHQTPSSERSEAHLDLFGDFLLCQENLHDYSPLPQMSLLSSGGPDGYCQFFRFCSCARKLARGSNDGGALSGDLAGNGVFAQGEGAGPFFLRSMRQR